jgi:hypothetical protein
LFISNESDYRRDYRLRVCQRYVNGIGPYPDCCDYCAGICDRAKKPSFVYRIRDYSGNIIVSTTSEWWIDPKASAKHERSTRPSRVGRYGFVGVSFHKATQKYAARIRHDGTQVHIGLFPDAPTAAKAYDDRATELFGPNAETNASLGLFEKDTWTNGNHGQTEIDADR